MADGYARYSRQDYTYGIVEISAGGIRGGEIACACISTRCAEGNVRLRFTECFGRW